MTDGEENDIFQFSDEENVEEETSPPLSGAVFEMSKEEIEDNKRSFAYTVADGRCEAKMMSFIKDRTFLSHGSWGKDVRRAWALFMLKYLNTGMLDDMPPSWSPSQVLPVMNIATIGDAGTGKTVSMLNIHSRLPNMTLTGSTCKSSDAYIKKLNAISQCDSFEYMYNNNTWFKTLSVQFQRAGIRSEFNTHIPGHDGLQRSYVDIITNLGIADDLEAITKKFRDYTTLSLRVLHVIIGSILDSRKREFLTGGNHIYRLCVPEGHEFYQQPDETFEWVAAVDKFQQEVIKGGKFKTKAIHSLRNKVPDINMGVIRDCPRAIMDRLEMAKLVMTQNGYIYYIMSLRPDNMYNPLKMIPLSAINIVTLAEEDGRSQGCMKLLHDVDSMIVGMIYNTPLYHQRPRVYLSSGSDTQSKVIGSKASPLELIMSPASARDTTNTMIIKSELFRRGLEDFANPISELHRTLCIPFERGLKLSSNTSASLLFKEEFASLFSDPGFQSGSSRLYFRHKEVKAYTNRVGALKKSNIPIYDTVFVSANVVLINHRDLECVIGEEDNLYGINLENLSTLTEEEARNNRMRAIKDKMYLYVSSGQGDGANNVITSSIAQVDELGVVVPHQYPFTFAPTMKYNDDNDVEITKAMARNSITREEMTQVTEEITNNRVSRYNAFTNDEIVFKKYVNGFGRVVKTKKIKNLPLDEDGNTPGVVKKARAPPKFTPQLAIIQIQGPATMFLSREEHMKRRIYAKYIEANLEDGSRVAKFFVQSSKSVDQTGPFKYDPRFDITTIISSPDYDALKAGHMGEFVKSVESTMVKEETHLTFRRKKTFLDGGPVTLSDNSVKVVMRGVEGTITEILGAHAFNHHCDLGFRNNIYMCILDAFRREMLVRHNLCFDGQVWALGHERISEIWADAFAADQELCKNNVDLKLVHDITAMIRGKLVVRKARADALRAGKLSPKKSNETRKSDEKPHAENPPKEFPFLSRPKCRFNFNIDNVYALCSFLLRWVTDIVHRHEKFTSEERMCFYAENSPIFVRAGRAIKLNSLTAIDSGDIVVIGNWEHDCMYKERERLITFSEMDGSSGRSTKGMRFAKNADEQAFIREGKRIGPSDMLRWCLKNTTPELLYGSVATLRILGTLIATTEPKIANDVKWSYLLTNEYDEEKAGRLKRGTYNDEANYFQKLPPQLGLMLRRHEVSMIENGENHLYHGRFALPSMEGVAYPRPFVENAGASGRVGGIIVKTNRIVKDYTNNPIYAYNEDGIKHEIFMGELELRKRYDLLAKRSEASVLISSFCGMLTDYSSTIHYEQGNTKRGKCYIDMGLMDTDNSRNYGGEKRGFDSSDFAGLVLVGLTRADKADNVAVANVEGLKNVINIVNKTVDRSKTTRNCKMFTMGYETFR